MENSTHVEMKNRDVYDATAALVSVTQEKMKLKLAHRMALSLRALRAEQDTLEKMREQLLDTHVEKDGEGQRMLGEINPITQQPTWRLLDKKKFDAEWEELLEAKITVQVYAVTIADLGANYQMAAMDMEPLLRAGILLPEPVKPTAEEEA